MKVYGSGLKIVHPRANTLSIVIDHDALEKARYFVGKIPVECQWWHQLERIEDKKGRVIYHITDFVVPEQEVGAADVESSDEEMMKMFHALSAERGGMREASEVIKNLSMWCHSHVRMGVGPSGTDNATFQKHISLDQEQGLERVQAMMIFNKKDDVFTRVYDPKFGLIFENIPLVVQDTRDFSDVDQWIKDRVTERKRVSRSSGKYPHLTGRGTAQEVAKGRPSAGRTAAPYDAKKNNRELWISDETPTAGSSSDNEGSELPLVTAFQFDLVEAMEKANSSNDEQHVQNLVKLLGEALTPREIFTLSILLDDNEEEIRKLEDIDLPNTDFDYEEIIGLISQFETTIIEPPELLVLAVQYAQRIAACDQAGAREHMLDEWIPLWTGEEIDDANPSPF